MSNHDLLTANFSNLCVKLLKARILPCVCTLLNVEIVPVQNFLYDTSFINVVLYVHRKGDFATGNNIMYDEYDLLFRYLNVSLVSAPQYCTETPK